MRKKQTKTSLEKGYEGDPSGLKTMHISPEIKKRLGQIAKKNFITITDLINHSLSQSITTGFLPVIFENYKSKKSTSSKILLHNLIAIHHLIKATPFLYFTTPGEVLFLGKKEDRPHVIQFGWKVRITEHAALVGHLTFLAYNPKSLEGN